MFPQIAFIRHTLMIYKQPCHDSCYLYCEVLFCSLLSGSMIPSKQYIIQRLSLKLRWHLQGCTFPKRKFMLQPPTSGDIYCYTVLSGWSICRSQDFRGAPIVDDWWHRWCVQLWMMTFHSTTAIESSLVFVTYIISCYLLKEAAQVMHISWSYPTCFGRYLMT